MKIALPHTIENCIGEKLTFLRSVPENDGETLYVENYVAPGAGPLDAYSPTAGRSAYCCEG